jgi:hypothetical protein
MQSGIAYMVTAVQIVSDGAVGDSVLELDWR